ncbi:MAG: small multi-drug export protein [Candidatus Omnitrophica bacterium]|nr:small multi-drug export protein [Candidatus Omnitrophota bacterium]
MPDWINSLPKELVVIIVAATPVFELRGSIPIGASLGLPLLKVYFLSLFGNLIPVFPLLFIYNKFFHRLEHIKFLGRFFRWWFRRVEKKSKIVERWGFWGLAAFVAIPLPVTGAWTGTVAATLVEMKIKKSFLAITIGVAFAGLIVSLVVTGILNIDFFVRH